MLVENNIPGFSVFQDMDGVLVKHGRLIAQAMQPMTQSYALIKKIKKIALSISLNDAGGIKIKNKANRENRVNLSKP